MNIFVFLFIIFPIVEIVLLIKVGSHIGVFNTILLILVTGALGASMARIQGFMILQRIAESLNRGILPSLEIIDGALVLAGGLCLLDPGVIGDVLGFFLLVPWTRVLIRKLVIFVLKMRLKRADIITVKSIRREHDAS